MAIGFPSEAKIRGSVKPNGTLAGSSKVRNGDLSSIDFTHEAIVRQYINFKKDLCGCWIANVLKMQRMQLNYCNRCRQRQRSGPNRMYWLRGGNYHGQQY